MAMVNESKQSLHLISPSSCTTPEPLKDVETSIRATGMSRSPMIDQGNAASSPGLTGKFVVADIATARNGLYSRHTDPEQKSSRWSSVAVEEARTHSLWCLSSPICFDLTACFLRLKQNVLHRPRSLPPFGMSQSRRLPPPASPRHLWRRPVLRSSSGKSMWAFGTHEDDNRCRRGQHCVGSPTDYEKTTFDADRPAKAREVPGWVSGLMRRAGGPGARATRQRAMPCSAHESPSSDREFTDRDRHLRDRPNRCRSRRRFQCIRFFISPGVNRWASHIAVEGSRFALPCPTAQFEHHQLRGIHHMPSKTCACHR